jgi:sugar-specific transcriptional regulator TrmB
MIKANSSALKLNLRESGLTEYEASAYAALLVRKERTAEEIGKEADVPITRVYDTLENLVSKGFAIPVPGRPKRYRAAPPERAVSDYLGFLKRNFDSSLEEIAGALKQAQQLVAPVYWQSHLEVKPAQLIEPIEDLKQMEILTREIIRLAKTEVLISTALFAWLPKTRRELLRAREEGTKIRILMHDPGPDLTGHLRTLVKAGVQVRRTPDEWYPVRGTLVDGEELLFVIWASEEPERFWYPKVYQPQRTRNPGLIRLFRESFEYRWSHSRPLKTV